MGLGGCAAPYSLDAGADRAPYAATLIVTDDDAIGAVGDGKLSLVEAIGLANGTLAPERLSEGEKRSVTGTPGPASRDQIRFNVPGGVVRFPLQVQKKPSQEFAVLSSTSKIAALTGNDGDAISGKGIRFINGTEGAADAANGTDHEKGAPLGGTALVVQSSNMLIEGVTFERFIHSISFQPAPGAGPLENIRLSNNRFHNGGGVSFSGITAKGERSALRNVIVSGNEFLGPRVFGGEYPSKLHNAISFVGAGGQAARTADKGDVVLENLEVTNNVIKEFAGGVQAQPLQTLFAPNSGGRLTGLKISGNDISLDADAPDPAIYIWGGVAVNGQISKAKVSDVLIQNNRIQGNGHVVYIVGAEALLGGVTPSTDIHMDNVRILDNHISARSQCGFGITAIPAFPEMNGPPATGLSLSNIVISGNIIDNCKIGAMAAAVYNVGAPGVSSGNWIDGLTFEGNTISGGETGILVAGGLLMAGEIKGVAGIESNIVRGVTIRKNVFGTSKAGITVAGAFATGKGEGTLIGNRVEITTIEHNRLKPGSTAQLCTTARQIVLDGPAKADQNIVVGAPSFWSKCSIGW